MKQTINIEDVFDFDAVKAASKKKPTDQIMMSKNCIENLIQLVLDTTDNRVCSDIIWANTLPLRDFEIKVDFSGDEKLKDYESMTYRFSMFENVVNDVDDNSVVNCGVMTITIPHTKKGYAEYTAVLPMLCDRNNLLASDFVYDFKENGRRVQTERISEQGYKFFQEIAIDAMRAFYAVQVSLLNPVLETVFVEHSNTVPINTAGSVGGKNKRAKVRYVKRHIIHMDDINAAFNRHGFVRHTNIWWVCGHWREYKSGKRVFVPGYWKGPMRDLKNVEAPRSREIAV